MGGYKQPWWIQKKCWRMLNREVKEWNQVDVLCWKDFQHTKEKKTRIWINPTDWRRQPSFSKKKKKENTLILNCLLHSRAKFLRFAKFSSLQSLAPPAMLPTVLSDSSPHCGVRLNLNITRTKVAALFGRHIKSLFHTAIAELWIHCSLKQRLTKPTGGHKKGEALWEPRSM